MLSDVIPRMGDEMGMGVEECLGPIKKCYQ